MHVVETFLDAKRDIQFSLKSGSKPVIAALIETYKALNANPLVFQATDQRDGKHYLHVLYEDYELLYYVEPEFQGESILIAQHVYLENILRKE
jgi:uncharacterized protein involved in tellurium resistance